MNGCFHAISLGESAQGSAGCAEPARMRYSLSLMSDKQIFLSYSLDDIDTARHVVRAIEARGWPISWERYDDPDAIATLAQREALNASDCVVVLWSASSVGSEAIRTEASTARSRGVLVQAALDNAAVPMPFLLDEPTPLTDAWSVTTLVQQIARVVHDEATTLSRESNERAPKLEARVLEIAEEHADAGELTQAITTYERWVEERANDMKAVRRLGDLYLAADRDQDAAAQYERVAEHYSAAGFLVPAIETYKRIVELTPYNEAFSARLAALLDEKQLQTTSSQRAMSSVQFTLTAPPYAKAGDTFSLDVWAHGEDDRVALSERLAEGATSEVRDPIAGPALTARIHIDGLDIDSSEVSLRWNGGLGTGTFQISTTTETVPGARTGVIGIYFLGLQIARIHFMVPIGDTTAPREIIPSRSERHTRAVACFAPEDSDAVEARIRAFEKAAPGVEVSLDAIELRAHDNGLSEFLDNVSARDVLYLFWSENAASSTDVEREWRYALRLRGIDFIDPVPLDTTTPPPELATLHDGHWQPVSDVSDPHKTPTKSPSSLSP